MANRKQPPVIRARSRGQISGALERYAEMYRSKYPDREVRYVYDPEHKPELSGILARQAAGYEIVSYAEIDATGRGVEGEEPVRVGDLVLMSIPRELKEAEEQYRHSQAKDQLSRVDQDFYHEVGEAGGKAQRQTHKGPPMRPVGSSKIEEREITYDVEQREE